MYGMAWTGYDDAWPRFWTTILSAQGTIALVVLMLATGAPAGAQVYQTSNPSLGIVGFVPSATTLPRSANCLGLFRCYEPVLAAPSYELVPAGCDPEVGTISP